MSAHSLHSLDEIKKTPITHAAHLSGQTAYGRWVGNNSPDDKLAALLGAMVGEMGSKATVGELTDFVTARVNQHAQEYGLKSPSAVAFAKVGMDYVRAACQKLNVPPPIEFGGRA